MTNEEIERIMAERNKAVLDLKEIASCKYCKHNECSSYDYPCLVCEWSNDKSKWEWRGIEL